MSDQKLFELCKKYGALALEARRKFIGLLPEVYRRKLYEKKCFVDIFEFAAKLAGVSKDQVCRVLNLEENFEDKPALKSLLVSGEVSANKLAKIASIATKENQEELADQVKLLSCRALETLARDERYVNEQRDFELKNNNGSMKPLFGEKFVHVNTLQLDPDVTVQLEKLQAKGIDINGLIRQMLQQRNEEIEKEKEAISEKVIQQGSTNSRYVQVSVKKLLKKEHGTKCSINHCKKPAAEIHHGQRFGLSKIHDPKYMAPFCREHHQIAHSIDVKVQDKRTAALSFRPNSA